MKTATISELEREELMAQEFPMEDLETVYGGVEMEEPDGFWEDVLVAVLKAILVALIIDLIKWAWEKFWGWIKSHKDLIIGFIAAIPFIGWVAAPKYAAMSDAEREKLWRDFYNKHH